MYYGMPRRQLSVLGQGKTLRAILFSENLLLDYSLTCNIPRRTSRSHAAPALRIRPFRQPLHSGKPLVVFLCPYIESLEETYNKSPTS